MYDTTLAEKCIKQFQKALGNRLFSYSIVTFGRCIMIQGKNNESEIYIRIENRCNMICLNFSRIEFDIRYQRRGYLTKLVNSCRNIPDVQMIIIGGVCTKEMFNWCNKNGFAPLPNYCCDYFRYQGV